MIPSLCCIPIDALKVVGMMISPCRLSLISSNFAGPIKELLQQWRGVASPILTRGFFPGFAPAPEKHSGGHPETSHHQLLIITRAVKFHLESPIWWGKSRTRYKWDQQFSAAQYQDVCGTGTVVTDNKNRLAYNGNKWQYCPSWV